MIPLSATSATPTKKRRGILAPDGTTHRGNLSMLPTKTLSVRTTTLFRSPELTMPSSHQKNYGRRRGDLTHFKLQKQPNLSVKNMRFAKQVPLLPVRPLKGLACFLEESRNSFFWEVDESSSLFPDIKMFSPTPTAVYCSRVQWQKGDGGISRAQISVMG